MGHCTCVSSLPCVYMSDCCIKDLGKCPNKRFRCLFSPEQNLKTITTRNDTAKNNKPNNNQLNTNNSNYITDKNLALPTTSYLLNTISNFESQNLSMNILLNYKDKEMLYNTLHSHFLFKAFIVDVFNIEMLLAKFSRVINFETEKDVFIQGSKGNNYYCVLYGKVELTQRNVDNMTFVDQYDTFGEMNLIDNEHVALYSARCISKTVLLEITKSNYDKMKLNYKNTNNNNNITTIDNECSRIFTDIPLFRNLEPQIISYIKQFSYVNEDESINSNKIGICGIFDKDISNVYFPICYNKKTFYVISKKAFIELFGINYTITLILPLFKKCFLNNTFFNSFFSENILYQVLQVFTRKKYPMNTMLYSSKDERKLIILLEGCLSKNRKPITTDEVIGWQYIACQEKENESNMDYYANVDSYVIECDWDKIKFIMKNINGIIIQRVKMLRYSEMLREIDESLIIDIAMMVNIITLKSNNILDVSNTKLFFVIEGEIALIKQCNTSTPNAIDKQIRIYSKSNCIEQFHQLSIDNVTYVYKAISDEVILYTISNKYYNYLLNKDRGINDYLLHKRSIEKANLLLSDLYYLNDIQSLPGYSVVHDGTDIYTVFKYPKTKSNIAKINSSLTATTQIDHIFIKKIVTYLESKHYIIILYPCYYNLTSLSMYIKQNSNYTQSNYNAININKNHSILFYAVSLSAIMDYLHKKKFLFRNLCAENIHIDSKGYIKLTNFTYAKYIGNCNTNNNKTQTINNENILCLAPEVLNGEQYSFPSDYWSIGICLYFLFYEKYPYGNNNSELKSPMDLFDEIVKKKLTFPHCDFKLKPLLDGLLKKDTKLRISSIDKIKELDCMGDFPFDDVLTGKTKAPFIPKTREIDVEYNIEDMDKKYETYLDNKYLIDKNKLVGVEWDWERKWLNDD